MTNETPITRAVILSAGKGSRLYPHTEDKPKCLLPLAGRTLLEWQLDALYAAGVEEMTIVTGFHHQLVDDVVAARGQARGRVALDEVEVDERATDDDHERDDDDADDPALHGNPTPAKGLGRPRVAIRTVRAL